jgi:hypothetical protein
MDFIQIILGRYLLEFIGALFRYIYLNIGGLMGINSYTPFSNIWTPKGNIDKKNQNSTLNHMIGIIFFGVIIGLLIIFMT